MLVDDLLSMSEIYDRLRRDNVLVAREILLSENVKDNNASSR